MVLSDGEIRAALQRGELEISAPDGSEPLVKSSSVDLRLDPIIRVIRPDLIDRAEIIDPTAMSNVRGKIDASSEMRRLLPDQPFILDPGTFVIALTAEKVTLPNSLAARIEGKSSLARFGIPVHLTAPKIDPGWANQITLEIINLGPFRVYLSPMMEIATLIIERLGRPANQSYQGRFSSG